MSNRPLQEVGSFAGLIVYTLLTVTSHAETSAKLCKFNGRSEIDDEALTTYTICLLSLTNTVYYLRDTSDQLIDLNGSSGSSCGNGCWEWLLPLQANQKFYATLTGRVNAPLGGGTPGDVLINTLTADDLDQGTSTEFEARNMIMPSNCSSQIFADGLECGLGPWSDVIGDASDIPICPEDEVRQPLVDR